jgi:hypothetical protein
MSRTTKRARTPVNLSKRIIKNSNTTLRLPLHPQSLLLLLLHLSLRQHLRRPFGPVARRVFQNFVQTPVITQRLHERLEPLHLLLPANRIVFPTRSHRFHLGVSVQISNWAITPPLQMSRGTEFFLYDQSSASTPTPVR